MTSRYHRPLRVGTRGSPLALAQARQVARQLRERSGRAAVLVAMATPRVAGAAAPIEHHWLDRSDASESLRRPVAGDATDREAAKRGQDR